VAIQGSAGGTFAVSTSHGDDAPNLSLGDALAELWERAAYLLIDDLHDALALHAAVLAKGNNLVLLPGRSGAGKTRLSLWFRRLGFDLQSDEVFCTSAPSAKEPEHLFCHALPRPVILKDLTDASAVLRQGETARQEGSSTGVLVQLDSIQPKSPYALGKALTVFPTYTPGARLRLEPLTSAQSGLRLLGNCVNARNLARGGVRLAGTLARSGPAVLLEYGNSDHLEGTLDVLTDQCLSGPLSSDDLTELCATLGAAARGPRQLVTPSDETVANEGFQAPSPPSIRRSRRRLTIGMATYDDYDGVYFTIQSIRMNNPDLLDTVEFVIVDNNPDGACAASLKNLSNSMDNYRYIASGDWHGTAVRNLLFDAAETPYVLCIDSHVLLVPGALPRLLAHFDANPQTRDLLQGPLLYDDLRSISTHFAPRWEAGMYGVWATDPRGEDAQGAPFDIPMQGLGLFACRREAWARFNPNFRGFGGEEGYIHEKTRQLGGRTLCLPFLRWVHRFDRPFGTRYENRWEDRIHNYFIGLTELGLDTSEMERHFAELIGQDNCERVVANLRPPHRKPGQPFGVMRGKQALSAAVAQHAC